MLVAKEGYPYITGLLFPAGPAFFFGWNWIGALMLGLSAFVIFFFRDPERKFGGTDRQIASPADGRVVSIRKEDGCEAISIFLSVFNVHINRAPVSGLISNIVYKKGKFLLAWDERASVENEQNSITMDHNGQPVRFVQIAGILARRIICWRKSGESLVAGERIGLIKFGSRVDVFLPAGSRIDVRVGQRVSGGKTILGELP